LFSVAKRTRNGKRSGRLGIWSERGKKIEEERRQKKKKIYQYPKKAQPSTRDLRKRSQGFQKGGGQRRILVGRESGRKLESQTENKGKPKKIGMGRLLE